MTPFQSKKTSDLQAEYTANESDLATLQPSFAAAKKLPLSTADQRAALASMRDAVADLQARQAELLQLLQASIAEDNSEENLAKHAAAFESLVKVHSVVPEVLVTHAKRKDDAFRTLVDKLAHRTYAGHKMTNMITDAITVLAAGDLEPHRAHMHVFPVLRGHARGEAKAMACWIRRLVRAAGMTDAMSEFITFDGALGSQDALTFSDVAGGDAHSVTTHLGEVLAANGIEPAIAEPLVIQGGYVAPSDQA